MPPADFLTIEDVLELHEDQIATYGGSYGVRDQGLLESALAQPRAMYGGDYLHSDVFHMAAAYAYHLARNHPFVDGNKRIAAAAGIVFLAINGHELRADDEVLYDTMIAVATGTLEKERLADFYRRHSVPAAPD
jgi:death-on-curing protein